jgi:hypothetical protein
MEEMQLIIEERKREKEIIENEMMDLHLTVNKDSLYETLINLLTKWRKLKIQVDELELAMDKIMLAEDF